MMEPAVILDQVSFFYPGSKKAALRNISFVVEKGEILGIIGPTGAGKSTLCQAMNGIVPQFVGGRFFGSLKVCGLDTIEHSIHRLSRHVSMVFEDPEIQLVTTSVENEIAFVLENLNLPKDEILKRIPEVLKITRLEGLEKKHPHELSGGQKQRLAIAAALAVHPDLLVLDEPTSQLDSLGSQEVFTTLKVLNQSNGTTILIAGQAAEEMAEFCDRILLLADGEIKAVGSPEEIYSQVELLHANDLRPPQVTTVFHLLRKRGVSVLALPVRLDEGLRMLKSLPPRHVHSAALHAETHVTESDVVLSMRNLWQVYPDGTEAIKGIYLDIHAGEYVLIAGQNGAGKSTLVKHFLKLLEPSSGSAFVDGMDCRALTMSGLAKKIGFISQNPDNQIFNSSVENEVSFALKNLNYNSAEIQRRTDESLKVMGLESVKKEHPLSLPKGDRARVIIAAVLAMGTEILIFDEPTTGQDYRGARSILEITQKLHQMGKTILVITHHLYLMADYAERVIIMGKGTVSLDAPLREAFHSIDVLKKTYLTPPQTVLLAQAVDKQFSAVTPEEFTECYS